MAPSTSGLGARSVPMASTAMTIGIGLYRFFQARCPTRGTNRKEGHGTPCPESEVATPSLPLPTLHAPCSDRTWGRRDGASCARDSWGTRKVSARKDGHGHDGWPCAAWSVAVSDLPLQNL